ncbi:PAS domain-containing protein [bacterium]|nr:PAS domain-containing protein [candidate division CSSED10-310 bacterium]
MDERENLYRLIFNHIDDIMHVADEDLNIVVFNRAFETAARKYCRFSCDRYTGINLFDVFPFLSPRIRQEYASVFESGLPMNTIEDTRIQDDRRWTETRKIPLLGESGRVQRILTIVRDITDLKESDTPLKSLVKDLQELIRERTAELAQVNESLKKEIAERRQIQDALEISHERLAAQYRAIPVPTYTWRFTDGDFVLENYNDEAVKITNGKIADYIGIPASKMYFDNPDILKDFQTCLTRKIAVVREMEYNFRSTGLKRILSAKYAYVPPDFVMVHTEDITDIRKYEEDLFKLHKLDSIGVMAGGIAHDFNNILMSIMGYIEVIKRYADGHPQAVDTFRKIETIITQARTLTRQLLTFTRKDIPEKQLSDIGELIRSSLALLQDDPRISVDLDLSEPLSLLKIDPEQIRQVIDNLIRNALQAIPENGQIRVQVENRHLKDGEVVSLEESDYVKITISDTGCGIPPDIQTRVFDPYFTTKSDGSGLGLTVSYAIIKHHRGHISFDSTPGGGTSFVVYLPASSGNSISDVTE